MNPVKLTSLLLCFAISALLLAGCGGGDGDDDVPTAPATAVSINEGNAELISAEVLGTVDLVGGFRLVGDVLPAVQTASTGSEFNYPDFIVQQLQQLSAQGISSNAVSISGIPISSSPTSYDCALGGTRTIYGDVTVGAPEWIPTVNDVITIRFADCEELDSIILDGTLSITITDLAGGVDSAVPPYTLGVRVVLTVFTVSAGGEVVSADGDMSLLFEGEIGSDTLRLGGNTFTAWSGAKVETLTNYQYFYEEKASDPVPAYSFELKGKLASTVIGGTVSFQMTIPESTDPSVPFKGVDGGDPYEGKLWITTAANASRAHVMALTSTDVQIDVYLDGVIVKNIMTTWDDLRSLL